MGLLSIGYAVSHDLRAAVCILSAGILTAFGRRVVGGVLGDDWHIWRIPHVVACIVWAISVAMSALLGGAIWWGCIAIGFGAWLGHTVFGLWDSAGMGHLPPDNLRFSWGRFARDFFFMSLYGTQLIIAAVALCFCPAANQGVWWIELLSGLVFAPVYAFSWFLFRRKPIGWPAGCNPPLASSEWIAGFLLGALVCLGFLAG